MDPKKLIELKQERATLTTSIRALMDKNEGAEMDGADKSTLANMEARFDEVVNIVTREEKQLERERALGEKGNSDPANKGDKKDDVLNAFSDYIITGSKQAYDVYNALSQSNPTQGPGYLVAPEQFVSELIKELADETFMRTKAKVCAASEVRAVSWISHKDRWHELVRDGVLRLKSRPQTPSLRVSVNVCSSRTPERPKY